MSNGPHNFNPKSTPEIIKPMIIKTVTSLPFYKKINYLTTNCNKIISNTMKSIKTKNKRIRSIV